MAAVVANAMQDLALDKADAGVAQQQPQPGTPDGKQAAPEPEGTAEKAADKGKKQRRRRKPAAKRTDENTAPAAEDGNVAAASAPVDVASILKARMAAKKKGKPVSAAAQAALANAKARPAQKKKASKGRQVADPSCGGY